LIGRNSSNLIVGWRGRFLIFVVPCQFSGHSPTTKWVFKLKFHADGTYGIGSLYISCATRWDIAYTVAYLSKFMKGWDETHWHAAKHYLKGTRGYTIQPQSLLD